MHSVEKGIVVVSDLDGVLGYPLLAVIEMVRKQLGIEVLPREIKDWGALERIVATRSGKPEYGQIVGSWWYDPDVLSKSIPVRNAQMVTKKIVDGGGRIVVATSRNANFEDSTLAYLETNYPWIKKEDIFIRGRDAPGLSGSEFKWRVINEINPDGYAEDDPNSVRYVLERCRLTMCVGMIMMPWNLGERELARYRTGWYGFLNQLKRGEI